MTRGQPPVGLTRLAQRLEVQVHTEVGQLAKHVQEETDVVHGGDDGSGGETPGAVDL